MFPAAASVLRRVRPPARARVTMRQRRERITCRRSSPSLRTITLRSAPARSAASRVAARAGREVIYEAAQLPPLGGRRDPARREACCGGGAPISNHRYPHRLREPRILETVSRRDAHVGLGGRAQYPVSLRPNRGNE